MAEREAAIQRRENELAQKDLQQLRERLEQRLRDPEGREEEASEAVLHETLQHDHLTLAFRSTPVEEVRRHPPPLLTSLRDA